jgi:hypothetical protein
MRKRECGPLRGGRLTNCAMHNPQRISLKKRTIGEMCFARIWAGKCFAC